MTLTLFLPDELKDLRILNPGEHWGVPGVPALWHPTVDDPDLEELAAFVCLKEDEGTAAVAAAGRPALQ